MMRIRGLAMRRCPFGASVNYALDDVRSNALERAPCKTLRTVGSDKFCCRIEAVRHRTARRLWPEARPDIVGATAKQQIEALAMCGHDCLPHVSLRVLRLEPGFHYKVERP